MYYEAKSIEIPQGHLLVNKIVIEPQGPIAFDPSLALSLIMLKEGRELVPEQISSDIERLYQSGHFSDVEVKVLKVDDTKVNVVYSLHAQVRVTRILFIGNTVFSDKKLRSEMELKTRELFSSRALTNDLWMIHDRYYKKGYLTVIIRSYVIDSQKFESIISKSLQEAQLSSQEENIKLVLQNPEILRQLADSGAALPSSPGVVVLFQILERGVEVITDVQIVDANNPQMVLMDPEEISQRYLLKNQWSFWGNYLDDNALREDIASIQTWFYDEGYLDAKVVWVEKRHRKTWFLRRPGADLVFYVQKGLRYRLGEIVLKGCESVPPEKVRSFFTFRTGDIWSQKEWERTSRRIEEHYGNLGHLDFRIGKKIYADPSKGTMDLEITIFEGPRFRIRNIHIIGNKITRDHVIRRELTLFPGDPASPVKIRTSQRRLQNLGYFASVDIYPLDTNLPGYKDLCVKVEEQETGRLSFSAAFSDNSKPTFQVEVGQSNFDVTGIDRQLRGGGQRLRFYVSVSDEYWSTRVTFTEPWLFNRRLRLTTEFWRTQTSALMDYKQTSFGGQALISKQLPWQFWQVSVGYRRERIRVYDFDDDFSPELVAQEAGYWSVSSLLLGITRDSRNSFFFPTDGSMISLDLAYSDDDIGSYNDQLKTNFKVDYYIPTFWNNVLRLRTRIGNVKRVHGDVDPKIFDRFFLGGGSTLRGFKPNGIGPYDPSNGEAIGGQSLFLLSGEWLTPLYKNTLYSAMFVDAGNVWAKPSDWNLGELNVGAGLGIRIRIAQSGAISLDYGWPIHREDDRLKDKGRFHFNLGYSF